MDENKRIIEINGIKIEVDLRTAKRVDQFKVGDAVKVLIKNYSSYESKFGMIIGFDEFKQLPTLIVGYLNTSYYDKPLEFKYINSEVKDVEICPHDPSNIGLEKADFLNNFDRQIMKKEEELKDLHSKKKYFIDMFGKYFKAQEE